MEMPLDGIDVEKIFLRGTFESKRITRTYGKEKVKPRKEKERLLNEKVAMAQVALELEPQDMGLQATLAIVEVELKDFLAIKIEWMLQIAQKKWLMVENQCSTTLAATFKQQALQKEILSLKDEVGNIQTAWEEVAKMARRHFMRLFGMDSPPYEVAM